MNIFIWRINSYLIHLIQSNLLYWLIDLPVFDSIWFHLIMSLIQIGFYWIALIDWFNIKLSFHSIKLIRMNWLMKYHTLPLDWIQWTFIWLIWKKTLIVYGENVVDCRRKEKERKKERKKEINRLRGEEGTIYVDMATLETSLKRRCLWPLDGVL